MERSMCTALRIEIALVWGILDRFYFFASPYFVFPEFDVLIVISQNAS